MTTEPSLQGLLEFAAQSYEPPVDGPERVLAQIRERGLVPTRSARIRARLAIARRPALAVFAGVSVLGVLVALIVGLHAGSGSQSSATSAAPAVGRVLSGPAAGPTAGPASPPNGNAAGKPAPASRVPSQQARVVQTAQLALQVPAGKVPAALDRLANIASGLGGYVAQSRSDQGVAPAAGTITLRVPVAAYATAAQQARAVGHETGASSQAQDVTGPYVDLVARISALQQTRATYLTVLTKASSIGDILAVQQQIQEVQTQIEQLQGQQKLLADTSDLATISLTVTETGVATPGPTSHSGFGTAFHHAVSGFATGLQALIALSGPALLVLLVLALASALARAGYRLLRRRQL